MARYEAVVNLISYDRRINTDQIAGVAGMSVAQVCIQIGLCRVVLLAYRAPCHTKVEATVILHRLFVGEFLLAKIARVRLLLGAAISNTRTVKAIIHPADTTN